MLSRKFFILLFLTLALPQNAMSGYGFGSSVDNSDASSVGVSNQLLPSFKIMFLYQILLLGIIYYFHI